MNTKRFILAALVVWIVSAVLRLLTCGWLFKWVYELPPVIWESVEAMSTTSGLVGSYLVALVIAIVFVGVYAKIKSGIPGETNLKRGLAYGLIVWLVSGFSGIISMPFYMTVSTTVVIYWVIQLLVVNLINGALVAVIYK